jgi:hypothetical protein
MEVRRLKQVIFVAFLAVATLYTVFSAAADDTARRLQKKAADAEAGVRILASQGGDPSRIVALLQEVKPALDAGDPRKAEELLDRALSLLHTDSPLPVSAGVENESDLYTRAEPVRISGYAGSAMEPFLSPDGRYLFFNNENDPNVDTNLYFAERTAG